MGLKPSCLEIRQAVDMQGDFSFRLRKRAVGMSQSEAAML